MFVEINKSVSPNLPFVPMTIGESREQQKIHRPSGYELHQFIWVTAGEGVFTAGDKNKVLTKGQGFFSKKNVAHAYQSTGGAFSTMWLTFLNGESLLDYYNVGDFFFFSTPDFLLSSTTELMELCRNSFSGAIRSAHGFAWATELLDALFKKPITKAEQITQFLEHNLDKPLTLQEIADYIGTDKFQLCHLYANSTGKTVMQALKRIRIQKAKNLLRYSAYTIRQIGKMCGYESDNYFIQTFREETGSTPQQYRQRKR